MKPMYLSKVLILIIFLLIFKKHEVNSKTKIYDIKKVSELFSNFVRKYDKKYVSDECEYERRLKIFTQNIKTINRRNKERCGVESRINMFSDMTASELKILSSFNKNGTCRRASKSKTCKLRGSVPDEFDWRYYNIVTPVIYQGQCASCWAIAAVAAVETFYAMKYDNLVRLSSQQLLDCTDSHNTCGGGLPCDGLNIAAERFGGIVSEASYPYTARRGTCQMERMQLVARIGESRRHYPKDEEELKALIYNRGPMVAGMIVSGGFYSYHTGLATASWLGCIPTDDITHAVLLVGYGIENGFPYWIIKNSYGVQWGEGGYLRMERGNNACKILSYILEAVVY